MDMLESYHLFITLHFHDSGDQESQFLKNIAHFSNYFYFFIILQIKPATNLNLIAFRLQQMLYYVNFI